MTPSSLEPSKSPHSATGTKDDEDDEEEDEEAGSPRRQSEAWAWAVPLRPGPLSAMKTSYFKKKKRETGEEIQRRVNWSCRC